ncbi:hypothetical protein CDEST_03322 [Colletotrichum destructivum]|uniref:Uncharacterized protein n=1 Tax=Colletotrichum destructivum TaxID=34406 RepID=A0AAX4I5P3_9PEZI|nr:hypothetical protein CDEST_03322 [Colletotrichum destructivum]
MAARCLPPEPFQSTKSPSPPPPLSTATLHKPGHRLSQHPLWRVKLATPKRERRRLQQQLAWMGGQEAKKTNNPQDIFLFIHRAAFPVQRCRSQKIRTTANLPSTLGCSATPPSHQWVGIRIST